jgi:hypothetical protein
MAATAALWRQALEAWLEHQSKDMSTWYVIRLPPGTNFESIRKETGTQGRIFIIFDVDMTKPCWCSQSMPALIAAYNSHRSREKRLFASAAYRVLRGESTSALHKGHRFIAFRREALQEFNEHIAKFSACFIVTKEAGAWCLASAADGTAAAGPAALSQPAADAAGG